MNKFEYCKRCLEKRSGVECQYTYLIEDIFGEAYQHHSCPDQEFWGQDSNVDMKFIKNNGADILEIEVKSIHVEFDETNSVAHDKYMALLQEDLSEVIDSSIALLVNIHLKKGINSAIYQKEIKNKLIQEIGDADLDQVELPKVFENEFCKIELEDIPLRFKQHHLLFGVSNPLAIQGGPKDITISEIDNTILNLDGVIDKINAYLTDKRVRRKYKIDNSKKVILFVLEYAHALGFFVDVYNKLRREKLYEEIMELIGKHINFDAFFNQIIVALEPMDSNQAIYIALAK